MPRYLAPALLVAITTITFANSFAGEFTYDDFRLITNNPEIKYWHFWDLWGVTSRSVRTLSLMLDYHIFGESKPGYMYQNLFWHISSVLLLYIFSLKLSKQPVVAFVTAIIFAIHPIHVEAVANIANRKEALCMTFSLLSFLSYLQFLERKEKSKWFYLGAALLTFYLATNSKQIAMVLPLCIAIYEQIFLEKKKRFLLNYPSLFILFTVVGAIIVYIIEIRGLDFFKGGVLNDYNFTSALLYAPTAAWHHLSLFFSPINLSPNYLIQVPEAKPSFSIATSWLLTTFFIAFLVYLVRRNRLILFGLLWGILYYLPVSSVMPGSYFVADRYMYTPSAGLCFACAITIKSLYSRISLGNSRTYATSIVILSAIVVICFASLTWLNNSIWTDELRLWAHQIKLYPGIDGKAYYNRGTAYSLLENHTAAIKDFNTALSIEPNYAKAYNNRGLANGHLRHYAAAIKDFSSAISIEPNNAETYYNRGISYGSSNDYTSAIENFTNAISIKPDYSEAYNSRGIVYNSIEKYVLAISDYEKSIELNPIDGGAYYNAGLSYIKLQNIKKATGKFRKAAELGVKQAQLKLEELGKIE